MKKFLLMLSGILLVAGCSSSDGEKVAGASTLETENAYIVKIVDKDSTPIAGAVALVRPTWYVKGIEESEAGEAVTLTADSDGRIRIDSMDYKKALMEVTSEGLGAIHELKQENLGQNKTVVLQLQEKGAFSGKVELPEGESFAWVQVYGTDRLVKTDSTGAFKLDSMPPFEYRVRAIIDEDKSAIGEGVVKVSAGNETKMGTLQKGSIVDEDLEQWKFHRSLPLDSLVSDWMKPIADTTVVFVRLNAENFNFDEAMKSGFDLRFTDMDGKILESEIAAWDDSLENGVARIRLNGSTGMDSIRMFWGKTAAADINSENIWGNLGDSLYTALNSITIIDFDSQKLESAFEYADGFRNWYFEPQDSNVSTIPNKENISDAFEKAEDRGYVFHWKSHSEVSGKWSMIGLRICQTPSNFSALDSVVFNAKGSGLMAFALEVMDEPSGKTKYETKPDSNWSRISFTPDEFVEGDGKYGNMGWDFVKSRTTTVTIWIVDDSEIWIDEVRLYGINRDDVN